MPKSSLQTSRHATVGSYSKLARQLVSRAAFMVNLCIRSCICSVVFAQFDGPTKLSQHFDLRIIALPTIDKSGSAVSDLPGPALLRELQGAYEGYTLSCPGFDMHTKNLLHEHLHVLSHDIHKESSKTLKTALNTYNDAKKLVSAAVQDVSTAEQEFEIQGMTVQVAKKKRDHCQEELRVAAETYDFVLRETMVCAKKLKGNGNVVELTRTIKPWWLRMLPLLRAQEG